MTLTAECSVFLCLFLLFSTNYCFKYEVNHDERLLHRILQINTLLEDPDAFRNVSQLIQSKGYPVENYEVQTKDGYILSVQHIPHGRQKSFGQYKGVVLLQHGLLASSADYVMNSESQSLGFILADQGYDVWLGNSRGNTYSRKHTKYSPTSKEFWKFSFDELGAYDLPAVIDFILDKTSQPQLFYVGHSQGTSAAFALLSENSEYNKKIKLFIGLAPVATVGYMTSAIKYIAPFAYDIQLIDEFLGDGEFLPSNLMMKILSYLVCNSHLKIICQDIIFLVAGTEYSELNSTRLEVYTSHSPAGTSTQDVVHFAQMVKSKKFQKYDFGASGNKAHYNQSTPPMYNLKNISVPMAFFSSRNDVLADPIDIGILVKSVRPETLVFNKIVDDPFFSHLDFVWGINATEYVYNDILSLLNKYSNNWGPSTYFSKGYHL